MAKKPPSKPVYYQLAMPFDPVFDASQLVPRKARAKPKKAATKAGTPKKRRATPARSPKPGADTDEPWSIILRRFR